MSAAKFTPGPWVQHPSFPWIIKQDQRPIADAEDGVTVCNTTAHEGSGFFPTPEEGRANARLIAAAPELLEALQWALDAMAARNPVWTEGERYAAARAAIAKATGGASHG